MRRPKPCDSLPLPKTAAGAECRAALAGHTAGQVPPSAVPAAALTTAVGAIALKIATLAAVASALRPPLTIASGTIGATAIPRTLSGTLPPIWPPTRTVTPAGTIGTAGKTGALSCVLALSSTATVLALAILMPVLTAHLLARALSLALAILIPVLISHLPARAWPLSRTRQGLLLRLSRAGGRACCQRSLTARSERSKDCKGKWNKRIHSLLLQQRFNPCPDAPTRPSVGH